MIPFRFGIPDTKGVRWEAIIFATLGYGKIVGAGLLYE